MIIQTTKALPARRKHDFYPTPPEFAEVCLLSAGYLRPQLILDPGAGDGVWGEEARKLWPEAHIVAVEPYRVPAHGVYQEWWRQDFLEWLDPRQFDLVMGNPPYKYAEAFVRRSLACLRLGGVLALLLPLRFLESQRRMELWAEHPPIAVSVCANRPSFDGTGKTNATAYAFYFWRKGYRGTTKLTWQVVKGYTDADG